MTTANLSALTWQVYAGNVTDLIAPVLVDLSTYAGVSVSPVGAGIGAASIVPATGVVIDNMGGTGDLTVQIGPISTLVPRYQKANLPIANAANPVAFSGSGIKPVAYFYTGTFHGEGGSLNAFASQEAANVASITGGTTDAYLDSIKWNINVALPNGANLDNLNTSGFYDVLNPTNAGTALPGGTWQIDCRVYSSSNAYIYQKARNILSPDTEVYERRCLAGNGWSPWRNIGLTVTGQCQFQYTNATTCTLAAYNGNLLTINGNQEIIPATGVTISNTIGTTTLAANTFYYCYAYMNGATMMLEWSTTAYGLDGRGCPIKSGDASRTLVGIAYANGSSQFVNTNTARNVASYFNPVARSIYLPVNSGARSASTTLIQISVSSTFVSFQTTLVQVNGFGIMWNDNAGFDVQSVAAVDGTSFGGGVQGTSANNGTHFPAGGAASGYFSTGFHTLTQLGNVSGGTGNWSCGLFGSLIG